MFLLILIDCEVYTLKSVPFVRQYALNIFSIPIYYFANKHVFVAKRGDYQRIVVRIKPKMIMS